MADSRSSKPPRIAGVVRGAADVLRALMEDQGVTKAELARRVGKSRAYVTQALGGERNMTLGTFSSFADALGADPVVDVRPRDDPPGKLVPKRPSTARSKPPERKPR